MEWYEASALRLACLGRALPEERAAQLLTENIDELRIICSQRSDLLDRSDDANSPFFNCIQRVTELAKATKRKPIEFTDDATGEKHLEMVECDEYIAYGEWYTVTGGAGEGAVGPVRRTRDEVHSGSEVFRKRDDGQIHQYGAASALLARALEVKALQPLEG